MNFCHPQRMPSEISLPERVLSSFGVMFVTLRTLGEFEEFWASHQGQFAFACQSFCAGDTPPLLHEYQWVFGPSKEAVMSTVLRKEATGLSCEFNDWIVSDPEEGEHYFTAAEEYRAEKIKAGHWSAEAESSYNARSRGVYTGYWRFTNFPVAVIEYDILGGIPEITDSTMAVEFAFAQLLRQFFDRISNDEAGYGVDTHDREGIEYFIQYWRGEQADGREYYGEEHEADACTASTTD